MEKVAPTLFLEIYSKHFGAAYDVAQESTWWWLTAQHISDFYTPAYMKEHPPNICLMLHKGHRPKMFLWMIEEFAFILCHLPKDDRDGALVLGHKLLLVHSHCCRKRGSCRAGATPLDTLPMCSFQTLETAMLAPDTIQHGWCLTILWDQVKHHCFPVSKHTTKLSDVWWEKHTKEYTHAALCIHLPHLAWKEPHQTWRAQSPRKVPNPSII